MGAPNVGKSSLVQLLSSGLPEVQNYPFTTRSIKMGHFYVVGRRHQVTGGSWQGCERPRRECVLHDCTAVTCLVSRSSCHTSTTPALAAGFQTVPRFCPSTTDTPGLLNRAEEDRNAMERLTLACLQHLPTAVLFVVDLTGECGTTVANQWHIR